MCSTSITAAIKQYRKKCRVLEEYTWIVSSIRKETESGRSLNDAINHCIEMIPEDFVIHNVILAERRRVAAMLFDEMGDARQIEKLRYELREKFINEGIEQGINKTKAKVIRSMILDGCDDSFILKIADVTPEYLKTIRDDSVNE